MQCPQCHASPDISIGRDVQLNLWLVNRSGQPGRFVRIAACRKDEALQGGPSKLVPTWVTEGVSQVGNIVYPLFNKAWAIKQVGCGCDVLQVRMCLYSELLQELLCVLPSARVHCCRVQFMELARPAEEFVLVLDSDMLIYKPFIPTDFNLAKGVAASENM